MIRTLKKNNTKRPLAQDAQTVQTANSKSVIIPLIAVAASTTSQRVTTPLDMRKEPRAAASASV